MKLILVQRCITVNWNRVYFKVTIENDDSNLIWWCSKECIDVNLAIKQTGFPFFRFVESE